MLNGSINHVSLTVSDLARAVEFFTPFLRFLGYELEGPSNGEATVWEDWLQVQARDAYDIAPRSVDLVADFPDPSRPGAALDLYARTSGGAD